MKKGLCLLLTTALICGLCACGGGKASDSVSEEPSEPAVEEEAEAAEAESSDPAVTLKVGGIQTTEDPSTKALYYMAEKAGELSGGSLTLEIYPASQLGSATNEIEAVGMGSQDMFVDAGWMGTFLQDKAIDGMWFTFENAEHYDNYINSDLNRKMEEEFCDLKGVRIIASNWYRAPRSFVTKTEIASAEDFVGMKIRVPDLPGSLESVDALGGKASQVAWGETYLALQQGVVDAAEGPFDNLYSMNFYEAAPYVTVTEHNRDSMQVMINDRIFSNLTENQQEALVQAALEAGDWYSAQIQSVCEEAKKAMEENGAVITELSEDQIAAMRTKIQERTAELDGEETYWAAGLYQQIMDLR
ncbi:MAG: TRAP transporter substrate-binding protein [Lachnospiraceae bacterium]|nr:TRAP transporter substrate-binding protein [Lachnospiraceae bacterium]MCI9621852.1 TRAP transporter substrate-binding protein [Lachnospiraceae bacterium]